MAKNRHLPDRTAGEEDFIAEMTRHLLAHEWCPKQLQYGKVVINPGEQEIFWRYAKARGWVSKTDQVILAPGWKTAAAFLRR